MANFSLKTHLAQQNIVISWQRYGIEALNFMALGLFSSLILGLIIKNIGTWTNLPWLIDIGTQAQSLMGAAIGAGVAYALKAPPLVLFTSITTGFAGAAMGGPVGAFVAALIGAEFGKFVHRTTPLDIIVTPATTLIVGMAVAAFISPAIEQMMVSLGEFIMWAVELSPIVMSIVVAVAMGLILTLPISSAAIAISLGLGGLAAGAATVGCAAQMIGFAVMSYRDNGIGGAMACGLGTSMIQMPNILKKPKNLAAANAIRCCVSALCHSSVWYDQHPLRGWHGYQRAGRPDRYPRCHGCDARHLGTDRRLSSATACAADLADCSDFL